MKVTKHPTQAANPTGWRRRDIPSGAGLNSIERYWRRRGKGIDSNLTSGNNAIQEATSSKGTTNESLSPTMVTKTVTRKPTRGPLNPRSKRASLFVGGSFWVMTAPKVPPIPGGAGMK